LALFYSLSLVGTTNAWFSDVEVSLGNNFTATTLDFSLTSVGNFTPDTLNPGDFAVRNLAIIKDGSLDFQYDGQAVKTDGDDDFCNALQLEAKLEGITNYTGDLLAFSLAPTITIGADGQDDWEMIVSFADDESLQEKTCEFKFVFNGWQTDSDGSWGFTDEEILENNLISATQWVDDIAPESYIVDLDMSQTSHQFAIDYNVEGTGESNVKEVSLYYYHTFDEGSWRFFGTDIPDDNGDGVFNFTSPFGDGIYHFKTEAEDEAGNEEEKFFPDALCQVDTQKPITMFSLGEFGSSRFASQEILSNGNFEDTNDPSYGWTAGGDGDHQIANELDIVRDTNSFLIGFKDTDPSTLGSLPAKDFIFQDIDLPGVGSSTLSFWYRLKTEDILSYDWFQALVLDPLDNSVLTRLAHDGLDFFKAN